MSHNQFIVHILLQEEENAEPGEKIYILTEYHLESLIADAFKGKGFQKISELFEDKVVCASQRHSKALLNQMDRLINKELDRNEFKHVCLLMKCIQHFCKSDCQEGCSLIDQGLVKKTDIIGRRRPDGFSCDIALLTSARTLEFLKINYGTDSSISALVEEFYDTALVICKCNNEDGIKQLMDSFLSTLGFIITEQWPTLNIQLEALKTFNLILDSISRDDKKKLHTTEEMCALMQSLARKLFDIGDYDVQVAISEALCRMTSKKLRDHFAHRWFEDDCFAEAFKDINDKDFETDCRNFLNCLNSRLPDTRVHTFPCISVFTDMDELTKPRDEKLERFWIDFNVGSQCVSFYTQNKEGSLWDSVRLHKESLNGYSLLEADGLKLLNIYLKNPLSINHKEIKYVKIYFEPDYDIENATIKIYGEEIKMVCSTEDGSDESPRRTNAAYSVGAVKALNTALQNRKRVQSNVNKTDDDCSDLLHSQTSEQSSAVEANLAPSSTESAVIKLLNDSSEAAAPSTGVQTPQPVLPTRAVVLVEQLKLPEFFVKDFTSRARETRGHSPYKLSAQKTGVDVFEFKNTAESGTDIEGSVSEEKVLIPRASSTRNNGDTPTRPRTRSSHIASDTKKAVNYRDCVSSQSDGAQSEKSWILEYGKKSSTNTPVDYSRKKPKSKSKLKVLPLSCGSSEEEKKAKKKGSVGFTGIKKETRRKKGKAESLSFSNLKLPGVSGLLTPRDSLQHTSGTIMSDLDDEDIMDPLQEMSSPECLEPITSSRKQPSKSDSTRKIGTDSNEEQMELNASGTVEDLKKKRKRLSTENDDEIQFRPRKLFGSCEKETAKVSVELEDDVFQSESNESHITGCGFVSSFESFTEDLKNKMMTRYRRMEVRAQDVLSASHLHVSTLMNQIQQCNFRKLQHFHKIVAQELNSFETETQALKDLEKETLHFWEAQNVKINEFCTNQKQRIEAMDAALNDTMSLLTQKEDDITAIQESLNKTLQE